MAELLIRVVDKSNDDPYLDVQCLKRGDVVVICEDGHEWSQAELTNPEWRILKVPGVTLVQAEAFLGPEVDEDPTQPSRVLQRRAFKVDLDDVRVAKIMSAEKPLTLRLSSAQLQTLKKRKPRFIDPNVFD